MREAVKLSKYLQALCISSHNLDFMAFYGVNTINFFFHLTASRLSIDNDAIMRPASRVEGVNGLQQVIKKLRDKFIFIDFIPEIHPVVEKRSRSVDVQRKKNMNKVSICSHDLRYSTLQTETNQLRFFMRFFIILQYFTVSL